MLLVAGGAGLVPLRAMLRHRIASGAAIQTRLVVSARTEADLVYAASTTSGAPRASRSTSSSRASSLAGGWLRLAPRAGGDAGPHVFVCGPTAFAEAAAEHLLDLGHPPSGCASSASAVRPSGLRSHEVLHLQPGRCAHPRRRSALTEEHWSYMDRFADGMLARGPTLAPDRETWTGSIHIVELPSAGRRTSSSRTSRTTVRACSPSTSSGASTTASAGRCGSSRVRPTIRASW